MSDDRDERLLDELRALGRAVDPVPAEVESFAKAALGWRRIDAELAELLSDSALDRGGAGRRARRSCRHALAHASRRRPGDRRRRTGRASRFVLLGQLAPAASATVEVQRDDGTIAATAETDDLGRFRIELRRRRPGAVRRPPRPAPARSVETSWLTV